MQIYKLFNKLSNIYVENNKIMPKTIHITESQMKTLIGEMAYPSSFNFDEFRGLKTFAERIRYCEARLKRLSSGSSRIVYMVDNDKVLKLAKNNKGLAQNKVEIRLGTEPYYTCFASVYEYDESGLWVEMAYCQKAKKSDFKAIYGVPFECLCCMIMQMSSNNRRRTFEYNPYSKYEDMVQEIWDGDETDLQMLFMSVQEYIGGEMLEGVGDLCRISSWGIDSEGYFILIDYGLTDDVYDQCYRRR